MMPITYTNSRGESVEFTFERRPWCYGETDVFDMAQEYNSVDDVITSFASGIRKLKLTAILLDDSMAERDRFADIISYDTRLCRHGRLTAGSSYMECFVYAYSVSNCAREGLAVYDLQIVSDRPVWVQKRTVTLMRAERESGGGLNFPHDFPHNYSQGEQASSVVTNPFQLPCAVDIAFPGPCRQPYVIIAGNRYQVMEEAAKGQLIIVRGFGQRDVVLRSIDGSERSIFAKRVNEPGARIFGTVPPGKSNAHWPGSYNVALDLYNEGLVPTWRQM